MEVWQGQTMITATGWTRDQGTLKQSLPMEAPNDLWGHTWTADDINNSNFGVATFGQEILNSGDVDATAYID